MWQLDQSNIFQYLGVLGVGGLLMEIVRWWLSRGQRQEDAASKLRDELTRRYDDASQEISALRAKVDELWEQRQADRSYIDELEEYVTRLVVLMTEARVGPLPPRPSRRRRAAKDKPE